MRGESQASVAERFGLSHDAVRRHFHNHLSPALAAISGGCAQVARDGGRQGPPLLQRVEDLIERTETILRVAEKGGRTSTALQAIKELRALLELLGKASGELDDRPQVTVNLLGSPEWIALRGALLSALAPYPQAAIAAAEVLDLEEASS